MLEIRPVRPEEIREAMALLLDQPGLAPHDLRVRVEALLDYTHEHPMPDDSRLVAVSDEGLVASAIRVDSPGLTAMLFAPSMRVHARHRGVVIELLDRLIEAGRRRGMRLFQAMLPPDSDEDAFLWAAAGFSRLAELVYLERPSTLPLPARSEPSGLTWTPYGPETHALFCRAIQATYEDSLDCPGLGGLRDIESIIAGHKDTGEFDPRRWTVPCRDGEPVGCLLLARVRRRSALELVYMGLSRHERGRGLGEVLVRRTIQTASEAGLAYVTLAVDAANPPAHDLYLRCGFSETLRQAAWVLAPVPTT